LPEEAELVQKPAAGISRKQTAKKKEDTKEYAIFGEREKRKSWNFKTKNGD